MSFHDSIGTMQQALSAFQQQQIGIASLCQTWRAQSRLLTALPERYNAVMEDILGRLEAGSLFTEESCSFSQADLATTLQMWLEKAELALATGRQE